MKIYTPFTLTTIVILFLINSPVLFSQTETEEIIKIMHETFLDENSDYVDYYQYNTYEKDKLISSYHLSGGHLYHTLYQYPSEDTILKIEYLMRPIEENDSDFSITTQRISNEPNEIEYEVTFSEGKIFCPCFIEGFPPSMFTIEEVLKCKLDTFRIDTLRVTYNKNHQELKRECLRNDSFITYFEQTFNSNGKLTYYKTNEVTRYYNYENNILTSSLYKTIYDTTLQKTVYFHGKNGKILSFSLLPDSTLSLSIVEEYKDSLLYKETDFSRDSIPYSPNLIDSIPSNLFINARQLIFNSKRNLIEQTVWKNSKIHEFYSYQTRIFNEGRFVEEICYLNDKKYYTVFKKRY